MSDYFVVEYVDGSVHSVKQCAIKRQISEVDYGFDLRDYDYNLQIRKVLKYPDGITKLDCAFVNCVFLESVPPVPEGVVTCNYTFAGCYSLSSRVDFPETVKVANRTFYGCISIPADINLPEDCTKRSTFLNCIGYDDFEENYAQKITKSLESLRTHFYQLTDYLKITSEQLIDAIFENIMLMTTSQIVFTLLEKWDLFLQNTGLCELIDNLTACRVVTVQKPLFHNEAGLRSSLDVYETLLGNDGFADRMMKRVNLGKYKYSCTPALNLRWLTTILDEEPLDNLASVIIKTVHKDTVCINTYLVKRSCNYDAPGYDVLCYDSKTYSVFMKDDSSFNIANLCIVLKTDDFDPNLGNLKSSKIACQINTAFLKDCAVKNKLELENGVLTIQGNVSIEASCPLAALGELTIKGNGKLTLIATDNQQPCIGPETWTGLSFGRWQINGHSLRSITIDGVHVVCKSKIPNFSIGSYGTTDYPTINLINGGSIDCEEYSMKGDNCIDNHRVMTKEQTHYAGSTKFDDYPEYAVNPKESHGRIGAF